MDRDREGQRDNQQQGYMITGGGGGVVAAPIALVARTSNIRDD